MINRRKLLQALGCSGLVLTLPIGQEAQKTPETASQDIPDLMSPRFIEVNVMYRFTRSDQWSAKEQDALMKLQQPAAQYNQIKPKNNKGRPSLYFQAQNLSKT